MQPSLNPNVVAATEPPIAEALGWLADAPRGVPLLNLAQAVPSYPPDDGLRRAVANAALAEDTAFYTPILGLPRLRARLAEVLSVDYGGSIAAEEVAITAGGNHAFCMAVSALAGPGDEVILPTPYYFNHEMWCAMQGVKAVSMPCTVGPDGVVPDPEAAAALIGSRTRAILLVTPNNPTGTVYDPDRISAFFDLAKAHGIALLIDETYKDFLPDGCRPHDLFQAPEWRDNFIFLYSFSKAYSLTGYRIGALAAGPRIMAAIQKIADTVTICPSHIGQLAALYGLENLDGWKRARRDEMEARTDALDRSFQGNPGGYQLVSRGAFFAYLRHPHVNLTAEEVARSLVREHGIFLLPGSMFGGGQDRFLRAAFANVDEAGIAALAARLAGV